MRVKFDRGRSTTAGRRSLSWMALLGLLACLGGGPPARAFEPQRKFPDTWDTIRVFVDQLSENLNRSEMRFAAAHYVGTQKLLARQIDLIRTQNPDFLMLHYRLGTRESEKAVIHIHNNRWSSDWNQVDPHEDWFIHTTDSPPKRVYQLVGGFREYVMDISGRINGNTSHGWKEYWVRTVIREARACHADGIFADSSHPPYAVPKELNNSPLGAPPYLSYLPHLEEFYDYVYKELDRANLYFIPNIGSLVTTWDTAQGYYEDVHGAMVEGFGFRGDTADWKLQQNRTLKLLRNGKIYIAQHGVATSKPEDRLWYLGNFLLLKDHRSYVNMFAQGPGISGQLHWWPEYDLKLGAPVSGKRPENIDQMRHASGIYFRQFQRGLVLVNPTKSERTVRLAGTQQYRRVTPWGGGIIDRFGRMPAGGLKLVPTEREITLRPWSAVILLNAPGGSDPRQR
jgi:hypothetical protein